MKGSHLGHAIGQHGRRGAQDACGPGEEYETAGGRPQGPGHLSPARL